MVTYRDHAAYLPGLTVHKFLRPRKRPLCNPRRSISYLRAVHKKLVMIRSGISGTGCIDKQNNEGRYSAVSMYCRQRLQ